MNLRKDHYCHLATPIVRQRWWFHQGGRPHIWLSLFLRSARHPKNCDYGVLGLLGDVGLSQSSGAVWRSRWPSWAPRPNEPYGFCGRKATLNHEHALVSLSTRYPRTLSSTSSSSSSSREQREAEGKGGSLLFLCIHKEKRRRLWSVDTVLWLCPSLPTETLKWLSSLPILIQESFWWWRCSDRYIISLFPHSPPPSPPPPPPPLLPFLFLRSFVCPDPLWGPRSPALPGCSDWQSLGNRVCRPLPWMNQRHYTWGGPAGTGSVANRLETRTKESNMHASRWFSPLILPTLHQ